MSTNAESASSSRKRSRPRRRIKMARPFSDTEHAEEAFSLYLQRTTLAPRTVTFYRETIHAVLGYMKRHGLHTLPNQIDVQDIKQLLDCMASDKLAIATRKGYLSALKKFLNHFNSSIMSHLDYKLPRDTRPKVDWLSESEASQLLHCTKTPIQEIVIHCELCLGMRRVEVVRLRADDLHQAEGYLTVLGKGSQGGKPRTIPYAKDTGKVMQLAMTRRESQILKARQRYPVSTSVPENLILWEKGGRLHSYSEEGYGIDKVVSDPLSRQLGFHFSNHTLRRTFGRALYRAGVEVPTIAKILGHESTEVTLRYIGVDLDDMRKAMAIEIY